MAIERFEFQLFADYHQFWLRDENAEIDPFSDLWNGTSIDDMLFVTPGMIHVGTARQLTVPVTVEIHDSEPNYDFGDWDHIAECSINIQSGKLVVMGCGDYLPGATRIPVSPDNHRARIYYGGLGTLNWNQLEGDDHYKVVLWKGEPVEPIVLQRKPKEYFFG